MQVELTLISIIVVYCMNLYEFTVRLSVTVKPISLPSHFRTLYCCTIVPYISRYNVVPKFGSFPLL